MSLRRIVALATAGLLVLVGATFLATEVLRSSDQVRRVLPAEVDEVVITADGGDVVVRAGVSPAVLLNAERRWLLQRPEIRTRYEGRTLFVDAECSAVTDALRCEVDLDLAVPPATNVRFDSEAADVTLRGLAGVVEARTEAGDVRAERVEAVRLETSTDAGDVDLDLVGTPTRVVAEAGAGDVRLVVPFGTYRVEADSASGRIDVTGVLRDDLAPQRIEARTDAGDIAIRAR